LAKNVACPSPLIPGKPKKVKVPDVSATVVTPPPLPTNTPFTSPVRAATNATCPSSSRATGSRIPPGKPFVSAMRMNVYLGCAETGVARKAASPATSREDVNGLCIMILCLFFLLTLSLEARARQRRSREAASCRS
jgi:hypothetical protein